MTTPITEPVDPAQTARGRLLARVFVWFMAIVSVATFVFGWYVVNGQRQLAAETDRRLRTLAWATLAYASANKQFPVDDAAIVAFGAGPDALPESKNQLFPARRDDALRGDAPADLHDALTSITVVWKRDPLRAPEFISNRLPTRKGTLEDVGLWMRDMERVVGAAEQPNSGAAEKP